MAHRILHFFHLPSYVYTRGGLWVIMLGMATATTGHTWWLRGAIAVVSIVLGTVLDRLLLSTRHPLEQAMIASLEMDTYFTHSGIDPDEFVGMVTEAEDGDSE